jgi:hypothetical protein
VITFKKERRQPSQKKAGAKACEGTETKEEKTNHVQRFVIGRPRSLAHWGYLPDINLKVQNIQRLTAQKERETKVIRS